MDKILCFKNNNFNCCFNHHCLRLCCMFFHLTKKAKWTLSLGGHQGDWQLWSKNYFMSMRSCLTKKDSNECSLTRNWWGWGPVCDQQKKWGWGRAWGWEVGERTGEPQPNSFLIIVAACTEPSCFSFLSIQCLLADQYWCMMMNYFLLICFSMAEMFFSSEFWLVK